MNIKEFQTKVGTGVALVDFSATWCAPCKAQKPVLKQLLKKYKNKASIFEINVDAHRDVAAKLMIQSIPTLALFRNGKEIERFVGVQSEKILARSLDIALAFPDE